MPIAVDAGRVRIACVQSCELPVIGGVRLEAAESSSSSSIGNNSDGPGAVGSGSDGEEVQSGCRGALEALDALEESLPIRRSISKFCRGKSRSFTSLSDAASSTTKDLLKPENSYTRKRKNLLAYQLTWKRPNDPSKRPAISNGSSLPFSAPRSKTKSDCNDAEELVDQPLFLLPLHPPGKPATIASTFSSSPLKKCSFSARSFSMMDLQGASSSRPSISGSNNEKMFS
ncbi:hypothetical protein J5N97_006829 [Dioscorea zingiberensis]|uniref:Uncharacterized protein n=1 Tax=Dioscorea zingiberensis TaxID=325984 RepID=A0A9D5HTX1_9LILI|nr:hypothetical protein J5N97_006829 [Dioscorea zingiberensis]